MLSTSLAPLRQRTHEYEVTREEVKYTPEILESIWNCLRAVQAEYKERGFYTRAIAPGEGDRRNHTHYPCSDLRCSLWHEGEKTDVYSMDISLSGVTVFGDVQQIPKSHFVILGLFLSLDSVVFTACEVVECAGSVRGLRFLAQDPSQVSAFISARVPNRINASRFLFGDRNQCDSATW